MTDRLYYNDSNLLEFTGTITAIGRLNNRFYTVLDRSAFYPTSGGQSHDTGTLGDALVVDVSVSDSGEVRHLTDTEVGPVGMQVTGRINKERRRRNCQNHTAQHLLSAAFDRLFGFRTVSVHLGEEYGAVELNTPEIAGEKLDDAERVANEIIGDNLTVDTLFVDSAEAGRLPLRKPPPKEGTLRIIRIDDFECSACGGTHCTTTGGVGLIKIIGTEKLRGNSLVKFLSGRLAYEDYLLRFEVSNLLARQFTCHPGDLPSRIEKLTGENKELRRQLSEARKELLPVMLDRLGRTVSTDFGVPTVIQQLTEVDPGQLVHLASRVAEHIGGLAALQLNDRIVLATSDGSGLKAGVLARELAAAADLKGGGNDRVAQLGGADATRLDFYRETLGKLLSA